MPTIKLLKRKRDNVLTQRKGKYQSIYQDKRWKKMFTWKKKAFPLCERCDSKGKAVSMTEVHHVVPFDWGKTPEEVESLAFDWDNLESLCSPCHEARHKELKWKG